MADLRLVGPWQDGSDHGLFLDELRQLSHAKDDRVGQALRRANPQFALTALRVGSHLDLQRKAFGQNRADVSVAVKDQKLDPYAGDLLLDGVVGWLLLQLLQSVTQLGRLVSVHRPGVLA